MSSHGHAVGVPLRREERQVRLLPRGFAAAAAVCATTIAFAQAVEPPSGDEVVVTATRFEDPERDAPIGVRIIDRQAIDRSGVTTLSDLLSLQPGFSVRNLDGRPDYQLDLGGFGITGDQNTLILVDGQRLSEIDVSSARLSAIPLSTVERIEILQGGGAVLYGGGATGGVINIITRSPQPGDRSASILGGAGSYDTYDVRAGASLASQRVGLSVDGAYYSSDNYRENNAIRQQSANATLRTMSSPVQLVLKVAADDQDLRLPGKRTSAQLLTDRRGTDTPDDYASQRGNRAALSVNTPVEAADLALDVTYRNRTNKTNSPSQFFFVDASSDVYAVSPRVKLPHRVFGMDNTLVAGVDWEQWSYVSNAASTPDFSASTFSAVDMQRHTLAGYLQYGAALTRSTRLTIGGRIQNTATDLSDSVALIAQSQSREVRAYEISLRQSLMQGFSVWGKLGQSFRFATVDEEQFTFSGGLLEPQRSHDKQLGIEYQTTLTRLQAMLFRNDVTDEIAFAPFTGFCCNTNLPPTLHQGMQVEGSQRLTSWLQVSANYTYTEAEFKSGVFSGVNVAGNDMPLVSRHKANVGLLIEPAPGLWFKGEYQYVGTQRFDNDQTNRAPFLMPTYRIVNLSAGYERDAWRFELIVRNLLNAEYFTYGVVSASTPFSGNYNALPAAEQSVFASVQYRFH